MFDALFSCSKPTVAEFLDDTYPNIPAIEPGGRDSGGGSALFETEGEAIASALRTFAMIGSRSFVIIVKTPEGYEAHRRFSQPCWGELRKYEETHGVECTQPYPEKPTDLFWPFPEGEPVAVIARIACSSTANNDYLAHELFWSDTGWFTGMGKEDVFLTSGLDQYDQMLIVLRGKAMDLESTRLVNFLPNQNILEYRDEFDCLVNGNVTPDVALLACYARACNHYGYYAPHHLDPFRFLEGRPINWSGGSFRNRFDYSRSNFENPFQLKTKSKASGYKKTTSGYSWKVGGKIDSLLFYNPDLHDEQIPQIALQEFIIPDAEYISRHAGYEVGELIPRQDQWLPFV